MSISKDYLEDSLRERLKIKKSRRMERFITGTTEDGKDDIVEFEPSTTRRLFKKRA